MKKRFDVIGFGSIFVDNIAVLQEYPLSGAKTEILKSQKQVGGSIPTALKALSAFGLKTAIIGKIGDDNNGKFIKDDLFTSDISISNIICEKMSNSAYSQIWIDSKTASRTTAYSLGTVNSMKQEDFNFEKLPVSKFLHLDEENRDISIELAKFYKQMGTYISVDTGNFRKNTVDLLYFADVIMMPKSFAINLFCKNSLQDLVLKAKEYFNTAELIVITDGKNGSACIFRDKVFTQKSFNVDVLDKTGARNVHSAGILFGLFNNWKIEDTLGFASASAALKCRSLGNKNLPTFLEVKNFIKNSRTCKNVEILV